MTNFLKYLPVRRQTILKSSSKVLSRIKRLLQEYALSRPHVRFSLKVLSRPQDSWIYAPKRDPSVLDAIIKVLGAELAAQCLSHTIDAAKSSSSDGGNELALCHVHAILPKTGAGTLFGRVVPPCSETNRQKISRRLTTRDNTYLLIIGRCQTQRVWVRL